ncbi:putative T7SS-secreted protein [Streptomyces sp. NPDC006332]|uniref:putative T7SS-secreted protein n=1 Tax=Streptomyces sp. NPDC006332 TaxID=3155456 RepID=UPI0033AE4244
MGFGDVVDSGLGKLEDVGNAATKLVGEGVDKGSDLLADGLDYVGADGAAKVVEYVGDQLASDLGATPGEKQLGESDLAAQLVHGSVSAIRASASHLKDFRTSFDTVGEGMRKLDSSHWKGEAADTFREKFAMHPPKWLHAADACDKAGKALSDFADTVAWAQAQARDAIDLYAKGTKASEQAVAAYNKRVDAYNARIKADEDPGPRPEPFSDPGAADIKRAQEILAEARRQRNDAGRTAAASVRAALAHAPAEPSRLDQIGSNLKDGYLAVNTELTHVVGGVVKGTAGAVTFVRGLNPVDGYNLTHPAQYLQNVSMTITGLVSTATHPDRVLKSAWEGFKKDPAEGIGRLIPELVGGKGLGLARGGVKEGLAEAAEAGARRTAKDAAEDSARNSVSDGPERRSRTEDAVEKRGSDPIDFATGKMYLPQTDVTLPGALPLELKRRVESGYHLGRWFGPSWSSTFDQRLEIDSEGVIFVTQDGLLLAFPHPAPGLPTLPSHGPRWPLNREDDGYTVTDPLTHRVWHFADRGDDLAVLEQIDDRNGNWITFEYDAEGTPLAVVSSAGQHIRVSTEAGRVTAFHLAITGEELKRYAYTNGNLTEVINSSGLPLRFTYDDAGRVTSWTDTNDRSYTYEYDDQDRCIAEGGAAGHMSLRVTYDGTDPETGLRVTTTTTGEGHTSRFLINDSCQVVADVDPMGAVTRYQRDRYNRLLSRTDPLGHTTTFRYDETGNLLTLTRPDGREAKAEYNELGLPVKVVNPDGTVIRQTYDDRGNRTSVTDPAGLTTRFTHNEAGHLTSVTDPLGHTTTIDCDGAGLPLEITDPLGRVTRYERDALGRPVTLTEPTGAVTRLEWTVEGHLTRRTTADGTSESRTYDGEGNCTSHTDPMGQVSHFEYTHFDLLTARTDPDGVRYEFDHDKELRLTKVTNPQGLTWTYDYDAAGRLITETDFDDRTLTYTYDPANRLTSRTNALGDMVTFDRDELGRTVRKDAAGRVTTYAYDLTDQLAQAAGPDGTSLTLLRDRFGRLRSETVDGRELTYTYDEWGRRTGRTTPTGATTTWTYDSAGRRTGMTASGRSIGFTYDMAGRELTRRIGETVTLEHDFDELGRLTNQSVTGATGRTVQSRTYTYRADGNLTGIDDQLTGSRRFDLDAAGRVTAVHAANWTERYAYDEAGNQTSASWPTAHPGAEATGDRAYTGTRITSAGNVRYEHDSLGRITLRQKTRLSRKPDTWRYEWDAEDRLTSVTTPDGTRWRYTYDPLGRRTAKLRLAPDGETVVERVDFTWDGTTLCEQTTTSPTLPNPVTLTWDHQGLRPIAQTERITATAAAQDEIDSRFFAIVTDLVGTPNELIDEQGDIAWHTRSTLWGTTAWAANSTTYTPLRFPGQYYDPETGLHYNYFRHYDPETARYLTPDPLGLTPAPNPTSYVHNPHIGSDSLGLAPDYPDGENSRGPFDFREANPNYPADGAATEAMRSAPIGGNIDCSEIAEYILRESGGQGKIVNFTTRNSPAINIPENSGKVVTEYRYHDVYTDGRYVYDPAMSPNPIPYGDFERAIRLLNPGKKLIVQDGGYSGPLW